MISGSTFWYSLKSLVEIRGVASDGAYLLVFGTSPSVKSLINALVKNDSLNHFCRRFFAQLEPWHARLRFPLSPLYGMKENDGKYLMILAVIFHGGDGAPLVEHFFKVGRPQLPVGRAYIEEDHKPIVV